MLRAVTGGRVDSGGASMRGAVVDAMQVERVVTAAMVTSSRHDGRCSSAALFFY